MRIDRIDIIRVKTPFVHPFETSFTRFVERDALIVKVYSEGLVGYGECKAFYAPLYNPEDNGTCLHIIKNMIAPAILHQDIVGPAEFMAKVAFIVGNRLAKASIENALWELQAQREGKSLKTLLGGTQDEVKVGVSLGIEPTIPALLEKIEKYLAEGYHRTKIKIKPGKDIEVLREVRRHYPDIVLTVDANSDYTLADIELFKAMDDLNLQYIEQPLAEDDIVDHAVLQKAIKTPICLDESIVSVDTARKAIELGSCKIINIKSSRCGGLYESKKIHDLCQKNNIPVWVGGMTELGIGRVQNISFASLPNFASLAHDIAASKRYFAEDITLPVVDITPRCTLIVPDETNGVRYEVDTKAIDRMMVSCDVIK
ncbi:o-succinylbenzoate synthase [Anaeroselena agilis]|uniref:o-succinylbenzoate synthase n=1 Tax=Anaeroselena agilis TaxID=3063788 RepID=A0ABU3P0M3_9FIRM|nr:o-succinylbenzoate synthase [Selenomonadales bacterium 4137-cl]